ncbi:MAG: molybdate ABC transporter substrate-binding protein [Gammaproteobacteria bacterium]|nr:molybdate ABC transporter substrate-binding protein [Gammaproteobacteria bacterium]
MGRAAIVSFAAAGLLAGAPAAVAAPATITVFAAASLTDALQRLATQFSRSTGTVVRTSFAASSALARQIESGAPADVFVSADTGWMDYLQARGLIRAASRSDLVGNRLVLIAPRKSPLVLRIGAHFPLLRALDGGRLAVADPDAVPAGRYARASLSALGVWSAVEPHLVRADDVRAALEYVARGEVPLGIVYATDAAIDPAVRVVGAFPETSHPPIVYPAALTRSARPAAERFLAFLKGPDAQTVFAHYGFSPKARP